MARSQIAAILGISVDRVQVTADYYFHDNTVARGTCTPAGPFAAEGMDPVWPSSDILKLKLPGATENEAFNHAYEWVDDTDGSDCDKDEIDEDQPCIVPPDNGKVAAAACSLMDVAYGSAAYENACGHFTFLPTDSIENPWEVRTWWLYKDSIQKDVTPDPGYTNNPSVDSPECWSRMPYRGAQIYGITTLVFVIGADASDLGADGFAEHLSTDIPTSQFNGESTLIWPNDSNGAYVGFPLASFYDQNGGSHVKHPLLGPRFTPLSGSFQLFHRALGAAARR